MKRGIKIETKKRIIILSISIFLIVVIFLFLSLTCSHLSSDNLDLKLEHSVSKLVEKDESIRNCVLAVDYNNSYFWAGASGIAIQESQVSMTKDTPIYISSITKLYTATAIIKLHEQNELSLDDSISKYLSMNLIQGIGVYEGKDYTSEITVRELLAQTSGIADYYTEEVDGKNMFDLFVENPDKNWTVDEMIQRTRENLNAHFSPGTRVFYSDTNYQLLGKIIENVTQKNLGEVFDDFFFRPFNLNHTWLVGYESMSIIPADIFYDDRVITQVRSNGAYWADGGIVSTAEEMIVFLKKLNEGKIISKESLEMMHNWNKMDFPIQYGYGTMYFELPWPIDKISGLTFLWGHSGSTGSFLYYSEDLNLYIAGSINDVGSNSKPFFTLISDVMRLFHNKCKD